MKNIEWYQTMSLADEKYVDEANPAKSFRKQKNKGIIKALIAACACFALICYNFVGVFTSINEVNEAPDVSQYSDSEYYPIIKKLNQHFFEQASYKRSFPSYIVTSVGSSVDAVNLINPDNSQTSYQEVTDNQVEGVIEADLIKRSNTHIYYLDYKTLRIFTIDGENSKEINSFSIASNDTYIYKYEFYLSNDCNTLTIITQEYNFEKTNCYYVRVVSLDVSDPENIKEKNSIEITGSYVSSRMMNGSLLLITSFYVYGKDFSNESNFIPQIDKGEGAYSLPVSCIIFPEKITTSSYNVIMKLDEETLDLTATSAALSYSNTIYVSENHVFLSRFYSDKKEKMDGSISWTSMTEISCLDYDTFEKKGSSIVRGSIKDQWSMDEYEGVLRLVTTTSQTDIKNDLNSDNTIRNQSTNASLYCINLKNFKTVASVIDFAPPNESVKSVRFDDKTAYVCTSIQLLDPVFFFDLSDLNNITYKDTGTIEGFSTSLINFGNAHLLGIGRGDTWSSVKVEIYKETEDGVKSVCSYQLDNASYSTKYKSYYVDRTNQFFGFGVRNYNYPSPNYGYILLHFDGGNLIPVINVELNSYPDIARGVYIDGYMYILGKSDFKVEKVVL